MTIVSVDPGKMTGLALFKQRGPGAVATENFFKSWQEPTWDAVMFVDELLHEEGNELEAVVCESYIITMNTLKKTRGENWSLESIGALRYLCGLNEKKFVLQSPGDRKFASDEKLKAIDWWNSTPGGHANDAARHMMLYLARTERLSWTRP